jgi:hypothetical protein
MTEQECAKAIAIHLGIVGKRGGWLYDGKGNPVCQGWFAAVQQWIRRGWIVNRSGRCHIDWRKVPHAS